jgi:hypothetical protein
MSKVINIKKEKKEHSVHKSAENLDHIIAGTENAYKVDKKPSKKEVNQYMKKFKEYKDNYIKDHSLEEMVYENGSALALLYKEITRLNQLLTTNLQRDGKEN